MKTRKPTCLPPWPILLIAGGEKAGKTYAAAEASASDLIDRTLWVSIGEDAPDEYGAIDGARFEIVEHDGTYRSIITALTEAAALPDGPHLIVVDSMTRLWDLLCDEAQATANRRAKAKADKYNRQPPAEDVQITMDLWNAAKQRWQKVIDVLRDHSGPVILTARLDEVTLVDATGNPTKDKQLKVKAEKSLPFDVGAIVQLPKYGEAYLTGVRSLRFKPSPTEVTRLPEFTVDGLWRRLGLEGETSPRQHAVATGDESVSADEDVKRQVAALLDEIKAIAAEKDIPLQTVAHRFESDYDEPINATQDVVTLAMFRDELKGEAA